MSLIDGLLLTLASATICISLPKLLSTLLTHRNKLHKPALQETLLEAASQEVPTLLIEG